MDWLKRLFGGRPQPQPAQQQAVQPRPQPKINALALQRALNQAPNALKRNRYAVPDKRSFSGKLVDQLNPFDNNKTFKQASPTANRSLANQVVRSGKTVMLGTGRSTLGAVEGISGLYDAVSPGKGQNRVTKVLRNRINPGIDKLVKQDGLSTGLYKGSQFGGELAQMVLTGGAANAVAKAPKVAAISSKLPQIKAGGRIGGFIAKPSTLANLAQDTGIGAGQRSARGEKITPLNVAADAALSLGFQGGANLAGKGIGKLAKGTPKAARVVNNNINAERVNARLGQKVAELNDINKAIARAEQVGDVRTARVLIQQRVAIGREAARLERQAKITNTNLGMSIKAAPEGKGQSSPNSSRTNKLARAEVSSNNSVAPDIDPMQRTWGANPFSVSPDPNAPTSSVGDVLGARRDSVDPSKLAAEKQQANLAYKKTNGKESQTLPVYDTKKTSSLDKAFRDTQSIIERQGEKGKELSGLLDRARDTKEIYLSELQQKMPTVTKLARKNKNALVNKDFENFVDATQGLTKPKNDKVARAVAEWQATHPQIRQRAVDAGLDVGDLGPSYYPHFIDYDKVFSDKNIYNQSINYLVETGQAQSPEEAIKLLGYARDVSRNREFGNLEASRLVDLPFYDKTPNSLISYLNGSAKRIAQVEAFGKGDEKALKLISDAGLKGYDTEAMKNAFDVASGAKQYNPTASKISGGIRKYVTTTRLGLGALTNIGQSVNTGVVTGHTRTLLSMTKQLSPKTRQFVADTGVISDALLNDMKTQVGYSSFTSKVLGKGVNKITAPFFGTVEKFNRSVAATAGRDYALRLAQKGDEATLRKLGVTGKIGKELTEAQQVQAARKIVEKTQFKVDPQDLPGWTDSPGGKLVSQFRTFSYNQSKFISNEVLKPAAKGNLMPLARLMASLPVGYGLYESKRIIAGRPEEEDKKKVGLSSFQNVGGAGVVFDLYQSLNPLGSKYIPSDRRTSMAIGAFGGPAVGVAAQGVGAVSELIQRKNTPKDESNLEGKLVLGKNDNDYTDATPIARFGLQQIPIIGTAIKNRLLPFKQESNAEAGKASASKDYKPVSTTKTQLDAAFNTPEKKKFAKLSMTEKEAEAANDPEKQQWLDEYRSINRTFKSNNIENDHLTTESRKILNAYERKSEEQKKKYLNEPGNKYAYEAAKYEREKFNGKLSKAQDINAQANLAKLKATKDFSGEIRDFYGLSKQKVYDFITTDPNGGDYAKQLLAYGDAIEKAGLGDNKFRDKKGNVSFETAKSKGGKAKVAKLKFRAPKQPRVAKLAKFRSPRTTKPKYAKLKAAKQRKIKLKA